jgi:hypothetical protein
VIFSCFENSSKVLELGTNILGLISLSSGQAPTIQHCVGKLVMFKPVIFKFENIWFWDFGGCRDKARGMV